MYSERSAVQHPVAIATMLTPSERVRVDAAGEGSYQAVHRDSVAEVVQDLKTNRVSAVVVSVTLRQTTVSAAVIVLDAASRRASMV